MNTLTPPGTGDPFPPASRNEQTLWQSLANSEAFSRAVILLAPVLAFVVLRLPPISQNNFTDAMYYLGYANNFMDLIDRYGFIYYAVRFGPIFTEMAFAQLFGPFPGFLVLRYVLAVAVGFLLHALLAERYGRRAALLGVVAWTFNPVTARVLLSTYVDSTAVPFTLLGLCLLIREQHRSAGRAFAAGILMCAGASGNVFAGLMAALGVPSYALLNRNRPLPEILRELLFVLAGAGAAVLVFTWVYDRLFGVTSLLQPAIDVTARLAAGDSKLWTRPPREWLIDSPHIYAPFLVMIAVFAVWSWTRDRMALAATLYLSLFAGFYWASDLFFDGYSLSFYPYYSYWQAPLMLGVGVASCQALRLARPTAVRWTAPLLVFALAGPAILFAVTGARTPPFGWLAAAVIAALLPLAVAVRRKWLRPFALVGLIATSSLLQSGSWVYKAMLGEPQSDDGDLVKAALQLSDILPRIADDGKDLAFWYTRGSDQRLVMIQSIYLPFSGLRRSDGHYVELNNLSPDDVELLKNPQLAHVVIMDFSRERVDAALGELDRVGIPHVLAQRRTVGSKQFSLEVAHVILQHSSDPIVARFDATAIRSGHRAVTRYDADGALLTTGRNFWNWEGILDLAGIARPGTPVTVTVNLQVLEGRVGLALIQPGKPDRVLQENLAAQTRGPIEVSVRATDGAQAGLLVLRNWMTDGTRAVIRIRSVTVHQPNSSSVSTSGSFR